MYFKWKGNIKIIFLKDSKIKKNEIKKCKRFKILWKIKQFLFPINFWSSHRRVEDFPAHRKGCWRGKRLCIRVDARPFRLGEARKPWASGEDVPGQPEQRRDKEREDIGGELDKGEAGNAILRSRRQRGQQDRQVCRRVHRQPRRHSGRAIHDDGQLLAGEWKNCHWILLCHLFFFLHSSKNLIESNSINHNLPSLKIGVKIFFNI